MNLPGWPVAILSVVLASGCVEPRPTRPPAVDPELSRLNSSARAAYDRGSLPLATTLYGQARTRACALDDAGAIGNAAYNLALCRISLGAYEPARALLREAEAELARAGTNLADVLVIEAKLAYWQGQRDDAVRLAGQVLTSPAASPSPTHRVQVALLTGTIACEEGDAARARTALDQARQETQAAHDAALQAGCEQLSGQIQLLEKQPAAAARAFDRQAQLCRQATLPAQLVKALMRSGEAWRQAGQPAPAAERYFRAARSSLAQGLETQATHCVDLSLVLAAEAGDDTLGARARQLQSQITKSLPVQRQ